MTKTESTCPRCGQVCQVAHVGPLTLRFCAKCAVDGFAGGGPAGTREPAWKRAGIPRRFSACRLELVQDLAFVGEYPPRAQWAAGAWYAITQEHVQLVRKLARPPAAGAGIVLSGPPGTGKSHLAAAWLERFVRKGASGLWISESEICALARADFRSAEKLRGDELLHQAERVPALVWDGALQGDARALLARVLEVRYERVLTTLITTRAVESVFRDALGELWGALQEMIRSGGLFGELSGPDVRSLR